MVLAYAVPGVLAPLPADGADERDHAGAAQSARTGFQSLRIPGGWRAEPLVRLAFALALPAAGDARFGTLELPINPAARNTGWTIDE